MIRLLFCHVEGRHWQRKRLLSALLQVVLEVEQQDWALDVLIKRGGD
jgi:hypothetical protein